MMMRRRAISPPPAAAALAVLLLLAVLCCCGTAAARLLPRQEVDAVVTASAAASGGGGMVLQGEGVNGDGMIVESFPGTTATAGGEQEEADSCQEGNDEEQCMQRRLLHDAHLDYIYTQHKGRP